MTVISIDIETYSGTDILHGVYRYVDSPDFQILLFSYSINGGEVIDVDLANGEKIPDEIIRMLYDETVIKSAFNANFERICLSKHLGMTGYFLSPKGWQCTMVWCAYLGLPLSLKEAGAVLGLSKQKLDEGKGHINYFCKPCKPTKANGFRTRNLPSDDPERWRDFIKYNRRDVETEMEIRSRLLKFPVPESFWDEYVIDQQINDRGVLVDMNFVNKAIEIDAKHRSTLYSELKSITGLENPNSVKQLKDWLEVKNIRVSSLGKDDVSELLKTNLPTTVKKALALRQELSKTSVKKYQAMCSSICSDGRVHGMFQFYGARTGRWAGRNVQLQNLPRNEYPDISSARNLVLTSDPESVEIIYDSVPGTLSQLIRTAFVPKDGCSFYVADYSAIEARVTAWYANEQWRLNAFRENKDIYCESASQMFGVPVIKHGINEELRSKGKIAELALGYGGAVGALKAMDRDKKLAESEMTDLVRRWREKSPHICKFWWDIDSAVKHTVCTHETSVVNNLRFIYEGKSLFIELPSGRRLTYINPRKVNSNFGGTSIVFKGTDSVSKKWTDIETYGPKLVENIVQATARDILCYAMKNLRDMNIVMHIHDELVIEAPMETSIDEICKTMSRTPPWAKGLPLNADGYICEFYRKD